MTILLQGAEAMQKIAIFTGKSGIPMAFRNKDIAEEVLQDLGWFKHTKPNIWAKKGTSEPIEFGTLFEMLIVEK